jgi:hypothetical protein
MIRKVKAAAQQKAADAARAQAESTAPSPVILRKSPGRPNTPGSLRDVARRTRISPRQQQRIERHVDLGHQYPFLQGARWTVTHALQAGSLLEGLTPDQRLDVVPRLAALDPPTALRALEALSDKRPNHAPASRTQSPAAPPAPDATAPTTPPSQPRGAAPGPDNLKHAKLLVLRYAGSTGDASVHRRLKLVAGELDAIYAQVRPAGRGNAGRRS